MSQSYAQLSSDPHLAVPRDPIILPSHPAISRYIPLYLVILPSSWRRRPGIVPISFRGIGDHYFHWTAQLLQLQNNRLLPGAAKLDRCSRRSSMKLSRDIGVSQPTAWFILHRIREAWMPQQIRPAGDGTGHAHRKSLSWRVRRVWRTASPARARSRPASPRPRPRERRGARPTQRSLAFQSSSPSAVASTLHIASEAAASTPRHLPELYWLSR